MYDLHSDLDALDQGLQGLNMCELREDLQKMEEQVLATLIQRKEESEATNTNRSFSKGSGEEESTIISTSSPPTTPNKNPDKNSQM